MLGPILLPEQHQGDARLFQLLVQLGPRRQRAVPRGQSGWLGKQPRVERGIIQAVGQRPRQSGGGRPLQIGRHRAQPKATRLRDRAVAQPGLMTKSKNVAKFAHR
jgi:hypothetical protein